MFSIFSNLAIMVLDVNFTNPYKTAGFLFFDDKEDANLFCRNPADSNSHPGSRINGTRYRTDEPDTSNVAHPKVVFAIQNSVPWYCFGQSPYFSIPYRSACLLHFTGGVVLHFLPTPARLPGLCYDFPLLAHFSCINFFSSTLASLPPAEHASQVHEAEANWSGEKHKVKELPIPGPKITNFLHYSSSFHPGIRRTAPPHVGAG